MLGKLDFSKHIHCILIESLYNLILVLLKTPVCIRKTEENHK